MLTQTILLSIVLSCVALAQPTFDVASVKQGGPVRPDGLLDINLGTSNHGTVTLSNATLSECIQYAYGLTNEAQIAGPDWIRDRGVRFEIVAKAPPETPNEQLRLMLQTLLKDRFRLEMHRESRKVSHFLLTVAKTGPRMPVSEGAGPGARLLYGRGRLSYTRLSMDRFTVLLSRQLKEPVLNQTGLAGAYDVDLTWTPEDTPPETDRALGPDIFNAVQQQLGLKLEPSKRPLEVLAVDRAEKTPISN
jgi:uncharacterized protein (TIGR03435 family)